MAVDKMIQGIILAACKTCLYEKDYQFAMLIANIHLLACTTINLQIGQFIGKKIRLPDFVCCFSHVKLAGIKKRWRENACFRNLL